MVRRCITRTLCVLLSMSAIGMAEPLLYVSMRWYRKVLPYFETLLGMRVVRMLCTDPLRDKSRGRTCVVGMGGAKGHCG
jgi:hypothetical protein